MNTAIKSIFSLAVLVSCPLLRATEGEKPAASEDAVAEALTRTLSSAGFDQKAIAEIAKQAAQQVPKDGQAAPEVKVMTKAITIGPDGRMHVQDGAPTPGDAKGEDAKGDDSKPEGDVLSGVKVLRNTIIVGPDGKVKVCDGKEGPIDLQKILSEAKDTGEGPILKACGKVTIIGPDGTKKEMSIDNLSNLDEVVKKALKSEDLGPGMLNLWSVGPGVLLDAKDPGRAGNESLEKKVDQLQKENREMREILKDIQARLNPPPAKE